VSGSVISIWEVAKKVEQQQLAFDRPLDRWPDEATTCEACIPGRSLVQCWCRAVSFQRLFTAIRQIRSS